MAPAPLPSLPVVKVGGVEAVVEYAGLSAGSAGLYQVNVRIPESVEDGDVPVSLVYAGQQAPTAYLTVSH